MKKQILARRGWLFAFAIFCSCISVSAQIQMTQTQWENAKQMRMINGKAPATILSNDSTPVTVTIAPNVPVHPASNTCSCWQNRDATFNVVPFNGGTPPFYRNDDGSTNVISIPFTFCFYGQSWTQLYINNNGNVSFGSPYGTFTATGFPNASFEMVAPFWGDVQTNNPASGLVYYKITPTYIIVQWDSVGYYASHADKRNTFQLILTDGSDPIVPTGNVSFCYKDMQWTTGDASSGVNGFGGSDAVVGANKGDGVNYIEFGEFNQPGSGYNGPTTPGSGIDWLDNQSFVFDACTSGNNIPPTPAGLSSCDTLHICQGDTLPLDVNFFSPEIAQTTTIAVNSTGVNGYTIVSNTPGNTAQLISYLVGQANNLGYNTITITATDNGTPPANTIITIVVQVTASPSATVASTNSLCTSNTGTATVVATGGSGTYTYNWTPSGGTSAAATGLGPGNYTCTITDAVSGCRTTQSVTITSGNVTATSTSGNITCPGGNNGTATVTASGGTGTYTYNWTPFGGTAATATGLTAGTYTCTITDSNGCSTTQSFTITQPPPITATTSTTQTSCTANTGSATVTPSGGTPGYIYSWSSGGTAATENNLGTGTYTCTITDAAGCTQTATVTIAVANGPTATLQSQQNVLCNGGNTGTASVNATGGTPGYTYSWTPIGGTAATATGLTAGNYTCTITDAAGCITTQLVTITQPTLLTATQSQTNALCNGGTGTGTVLASGGTPGYTYNWTPSGGTSATSTAVPAGNYTCTITDVNGCTTTQLFTITQPTVLTATSSQVNPSCNGGTGTGTVVASGGTSGYTYNWTPSGGTGATSTAITAGNYTCTITDANGCTTTQLFTITQPTPITATFAHTNILCNGGLTGTASVTASGGTPVYTYNWTPNGGSASSASGLAAGSYTCTITDANGCTSTQTFTLTQPTPLTVAMVGDSACEGSPTQISASGGGGVGPYTYSWSNGPTTQTQNININNTTTYTCTVTDANGCTTNGISLVTVNPLPVASITSNAVNGVYVVNPATQLCFFAPSAGITAWDWTLQPGNSILQNPCVDITAADTGTYCAKLVVENIHTCRDTAQICIDISDVSYSIPNVFTPNGDGTNDVFMITNTGMKDMHCIIYDRWGVLINQWDTPTGFWDGKTKGGKEAVDGVYYWTLDMTDFGGKEYADHGFVELIRGTK